MDDSFKVLIKLFLPDSVEDYFELTHHKKEGENRIMHKSCGAKS